MNSDYSFLGTLLTRIRAYLDEPDVDGKYSDDFLLRHYVMPSLVDAFSRVNLGAEDPVVCTYDFTLGGTPGKRYWQLPANVGEVRRLTVRDSAYRVIFDFKPRSDRNPYGAGWSVQGNQLFTPVEEGIAWACTLEYLPTGDYFPHIGNAVGLTESSTGAGYDTLQLTASPSLGQIERRENGLAGGFLRLLPSTGKIQERVIERSYLSGGNWYVKVRTPFDTGTNPYTTTYEVAPMGSQSMNELVALGAAIRLAVARKLPRNSIEALRMLYQNARKTVVDAASNRQNRTGKSFSNDSIDNDRMRDFW